MRVNVDIRVSAATVGAISPVYSVWGGPVGASSAPFGGSAFSVASLSARMRNITTVDVLADGNATHIGSPGTVAGLGYTSTLNMPTMDFSIPWEARVSLTSGAETAVNISAAIWAANVVTFTTSAAHTLAVGDKTVIAGVTPSGYDGTYIVVSVPSTTQFTAELLSDPGAYTSGGTSRRTSNVILQTLTITLEG